jgi:hypothetical protein
VSDSEIINMTISFVFPVLKGRYSSSAIALSIKIIQIMLDYPVSRQLLLSQKVYLIFIDFANILKSMDKSETLSSVLKMCLDVMIYIDKLNTSTTNSHLCQSILEFAKTSRDFATITEIIRVHSSDIDIISSCVDALIGGRRRWNMIERPSYDTQWRSKLKVGDKIDARDKSNHWYESIVREIVDSVAYVHYIGWGDKYNEWISVDSDRIQMLYTETTPWRESLHLDDPIEILCLHNDGSESRRTWFRGLVSKFDDGKVLVVYDKRGHTDERWVNLLEGEEICRVGTHVPSSMDSTTDILRSNRKKELKRHNMCKVLLDILSSNIGVADIVCVCLEGIEYIMSGEDCAVHIQHISDLRPGDLLCKVLHHHANNPVIVELGCAIMEALCASRNSDIFSVGDAVNAQWRRRGNVAFPGRIARVIDNGMAYDIMYDDGDTEDNVPKDRIFHKYPPASCSNANFMESILNYIIPNTNTSNLFIDLLSMYQGKYYKAINIPLVSILAIVMDSLTDTYDLCNHIIASKVHFVIIKVLDGCSHMSSRVAAHALSIMKYVAESSVANKNAIFLADIHKSALACLNLFSNNSSITLNAIDLLTCIISKDGTFEFPACRTIENEYINEWPVRFSNENGKDTMKVCTIDVEIPLLEDTFCRYLILYIIYIVIIIFLCFYYLDGERFSCNVIVVSQGLIVLL